ncbi:MAG: HEAT repeat domain-containing protein [Myxococcales bacterium]|nr:HEAT repeat domain-containing protein [Myxococcales bacterium]
MARLPSLRDRLLGGLGPTAALDGPSLARAVRHGSEQLAVHALRLLSARPEDEARLFLEERLDDARVAVRKASARALGQRGDPRSRSALQRASLNQAGPSGLTAATLTDELALHFAAARVRCGGDRAIEAEQLDARDRRVFQTEGGLRRVALDVPPLPERLALELDSPPGGFDDLTARLRTAGRREQHVLLNALGLDGDPRALPLLADALCATDVDPGRGFTQRRLAATAIGRIGLRSATPILLRALKDEALDFEGRPGAGMGIQYPVRTNLVWALGEVGDPAAIPTLISYLSNTTGSAFGGFYLPAMDALWKLGHAALPALTAALATSPEPQATHALGVLLALGQDAAPWRGDSRPGVARVARTAAAP